MNECKKQIKALILSCSTGEGHNSAAKAVEDSLRRLNIECETRDVLSFKSERTSRRIAGIYNTVIKKVPALFGAVYKLGGLYDSLRLPSPVYAANAKYADKLYSYISENGFNCVICAHLFAMQAMTAIRKKYSMFSVKCYGVLTDYTTIPFYRETSLDCYFVPTEQVGLQLSKKGIAADKIVCTGIPVNPKFNLCISKEQARKSLNLPQDKKIVAVMTGGGGCGKVEKLCRRLDKALDREHIIAVFTGRNNQLAEKLDKIYGANEKFKIIGFTSDVHIWFKAVDAVISKAGGLSSTEAAVSNVPLVHLKAIPGLETANLKYFSANGLSLRADNVKQAVMHTMLLLGDREYAETVCKLQRFMIKQDSAKIISEKIAEDFGGGNRSLDCVYNRGVSYGQHNVLPVYPQTDCA